MVIVELIATTCKAPGLVGDHSAAIDTNHCMEPVDGGKFHLGEKLVHISARIRRGFTF
jgi:hypothetical protein